MALPTGLNTTLVLVRHGESTFVAEGRFQGRSDVPLTALGESQARLVAARLAQRDDPVPLPIPNGSPMAIWHSPLARTAATANAIADAQPVRPTLIATAGLTELAQGEWEGRPRAEIETRWTAELVAWRRAPVENHAPGGEALGSAATRVTAALDEILATLGSAAGVAVREPGIAVARDLVPGYPSAAGASPAADPWALLVGHDGTFKVLLLTLLGLPLERFWAFPFNLCAITIVTLHDGSASLRAHNLSEHMAPLAGAVRAAAEASGDRRGAL